MVMTLSTIIEKEPIAIAIANKNTAIAVADKSRTIP